MFTLKSNHLRIELIAVAISQKYRLIAVEFLELPRVNCFIDILILKIDDKEPFGSFLPIRTLSLLN